MSNRLDELAKELASLQHAVQSGVAMKIKYDGLSIRPKQLRVGVNSALVFNAALVRLLVDKGVFTQEEYAEAAVQEMAEEVTRYENELTKLTGTKITLG